MDHRADPAISRLRTLMRGDREVAIGARARRRLVVRIALAVLGVSLIAGSWWLYRGLVQVALPPPPEVATVPVKCVQCGRTTMTVIRAGATGHAQICDACGQRTAYKLWQCHACGTQFLPPVDRTGDVVTCPNCRSPRVGTASLAAP